MNSYVIKYKRLIFVVVFSIITIILYSLYIFDPWGSSFYPPCPFHGLTGLYCPGCGSLRALHKLLHFQITGAFDYNPLMVLSIPFLLYSFFSYMLFIFTGRQFPKVFIPSIYIWILLGIVILFGIFRNITIYPFTMLAP